MIELTEMLKQFEACLNLQINFLRFPGIKKLTSLSEISEGSNILIASELYPEIFANVKIGESSPEKIRMGGGERYLIAPNIEKSGVTLRRLSSAAGWEIYKWQIKDLKHYYLF